MTNAAQQPLFSVVIATFNRAALVVRSVQSVLDGHLRGVEVIVVDDGSTDTTQQVLSEIDDERLRVIAQPNRGRTAARNRGAEVARGRYLTFLDSDDYAAPEWLETMLSIFEESSEHAVVCCGATKVVLDDGGTTVRRSVATPRNLGPVYDSRMASFLTGSWAIERDLFEGLGGYDESLAHAENTELAHRLVGALRNTGQSIGSTPKALITYEQSRPALTISDYVARQRAAETIIARHGERYRELNGSTRRSNYYAIAGASAAHLGEFRGARHHFLHAVLDAPHRPHGYGRLIVSHLPGVRRLVWGRASPAPNSVSARPSIASGETP